MIELTEEERSAGALSPDTLVRALRDLREVGFVVVRDALPLAWVETMRAACTRDLEAMVAAPEAREKWLVKALGHVGMSAPMRAPYMDAIAIENPIALQIMAAALGPDLSCTFYNTNNAWPGSGTQFVHRDASHLFPELPHVLPVHSVVVNIPLVDFTEANGATEVWPGTQNLLDAAPGDDKRLDERAAELPSARAIMPAGSVCVRDLRMWHRGVPNRSAAPRSMLAIVYKRGFLNRGAPLRIPRAVWDSMSERARGIFRFNELVDDAPAPAGAPQ